MLSLNISTGPLMLKEIRRIPVRPHLFYRDAALTLNVSTTSYRTIYRNCKTAPSFARSPEMKVFERVLARGVVKWENGAMAARRNEGNGEGGL